MDVRRGLHACLVGASVLLWACGGDEDVIDLRDGGYPVDERPDAGDGGDAGRRQDAGGGMDASADAATDAGDAGPMDAKVDLDATLTDASRPGDGGDVPVETRPIVAVLSPLPSVDPVDGPVLTGTTVAVQCAAAGRQGRGIRTVTIGIYEGSATEPKLEVPGNYGGDGGYANTMVSLAGLATGPIRIRCTAIDDVSDPETAYDEIETFFDGGPVVTIVGLAEGNIIARGGANVAPDLNVRFRVDASRLAASDPDADVDQVSLLLNEVSVPMLPGPVAGVYAKEIDFFTFFKGTPIDRLSVEVVASNARGVVVRKKVNVLVDGVGPVVTIETPWVSDSELPFVGGLVRFRARATDALAGLANGAYAIIKTADGDRRYEVTVIEPDPVRPLIGFEFDANSFSDKALIIAQLRVFDTVGNQTEISHSMRVDTVAPWVSLDPPAVRTIDDEATCSGPFDPIGNTPVDGQVILQHARFRALVWERATEPPGATETFISRVNNSTVDFVAQPYGLALDPAAGRQLLVDRDNDGICDIVDDSVPSMGQLAPFRVRLSPVEAGGAVPNSEPGFSSEPAAGGVCMMPTTNVPDAAPKCTGTEMRKVISHASVSRDNVVYGYAPAQNEVSCTGASFDFGGPAGWYCVTTVARDNSGSDGNLGIAPPLRVCRKLAPTDCGGITVMAGDILTPPPGLTCLKSCTLRDEWIAPAMPRILRP